MVALADGEGEQLGLNEDEVAFYDALEVNDSAVKVLGEPALKNIARELVDTVRRNTTIDWTVRENIRANLRVLVKRILRVSHGLLYLVHLLVGGKLRTDVLGTVLPSRDCYDGIVRQTGRSGAAETFRNLGQNSHADRGAGFSDSRESGSRLRGSGLQVVVKPRH